jgi:hypothetical protein
MRTFQFATTAVVVTQPSCGPAGRQLPPQPSPQVPVWAWSALANERLTTTRAIPRSEWSLRTTTSASGVYGLCQFTPQREVRASTGAVSHHIHKTMQQNALRHSFGRIDTSNEKPDSLISANPAMIITAIVIQGSYLNVFAIFCEFADFHEIA